MIFITQCDSLTFWQTYLSDPASVTMEGIMSFIVLAYSFCILFFYFLCYLYNNKQSFQELVLVLFKGALLQKFLSCTLVGWVIRCFAKKAIPEVWCKLSGRFPKWGFFHFNPLNFLEFDDYYASISKEDEAQPVQQPVQQPVPQTPPAPSWINLSGFNQNPPAQAGNLAEPNTNNISTEPVREATPLDAHTRWILRNFLGRNWREH